MTEKRSQSGVAVHDDSDLVPKASIWGTVGSAWVVALVLTVYGAGAVSDEIQGWERLDGVMPTAGLAQALEKTQKVVGLHHLHATLTGLRHGINEDIVVGEPAAETIEPVENGGPEIEPPDESHPAHRRGPAKHRVLVIGASSIQFALGVELERRFPMYEKVKVKRYGQLATSLARPDFFDWMKKAKALIAEFKPDLIVTNFGGNDAQDILRKDGTKVSYDSPEWDEAFQKLVIELIELGRASKADTVMIGMPVMREDKFTKKMKRLNRAMQQATERAGALYISSWEMSSTADGKYKTSTRHQGKRGLLRTSDGVHYSKFGAQILVEEVLAIIERHFALTPKDESLARAEPHAFESKALGRFVSYVAYLPRRRPAEGDAAALVLLVPSPESEVTEWPHHPHRRLQSLAESLGHPVVLVEPLTISSPEQRTIAEALLDSELLSDLGRHFPAPGGLGIMLAPGPLAEAAERSSEPEKVVVVGGPWRTELEAQVRTLSAELKASAPRPPEPRVREGAVHDQPE